MAQQRLSAVIAGEKDTKGRIFARVSEAYKKLQKPDLFDGHVRSYVPNDDEGERLDGERKEIQESVSTIVQSMLQDFSKLLEVTATRDYANLNAVADVVLDGEVLLEQVPATHLLFLEKQTRDALTILSHIPSLDPSEVWTHDGEVWRAREVETTRTKKVQRALVLHPPTDKHPAQTQLITEDQAVGRWRTQRMSKAIPRELKVQLQRRGEGLLRALKAARERANSVEAPKVSTAAVFEYLFKPIIEQETS